MKLLEGKIALVTGASRGIGEGIATKFAEHGATVLFTYSQSVDKAKALEEKLTALGVKAKGYQSNAASFSETETLIAEVLKEFGRIDVLVNNAGITRDNLLLRMSEEQWDEVMNTNLKSVFNFTRQVAYSMLKQKSGSIINISSIVGLSGQAGQSNYAASKAGIIGFTKSIADELGSRNIRCNAIAPGFIRTDMTDALSLELQKEYFSKIPLKRFGETAEVADTALYLASSMSAYVTGQVISVCGGLHR